MSLLEQAKKESQMRKRSVDYSQFEKEDLLDLLIATVRGEVGITQAAKAMGEDDSTVVASRLRQMLWKAVRDGNIGVYRTEKETK